MVAMKPADHGMELSGGRDHQQKRGTLTFYGEASPLPPVGTIFPTTQEAGRLAEYLRRLPRLGPLLPFTCRYQPLPAVACRYLPRLGPLLPGG